MATIQVDVVILTRGLKPIPQSVLAALGNQDDVDVRIHRVVGTPIASDRDRLDTIVRARNEGKLCGSTPWLMFLDDDVVLSANCITKLVTELSRRSGYAALAADYSGRANSDGQSRHVAMGATLFRRHVLNGIQFRCDTDLCECQCCCDDIRSRGYRIAYLPTAGAQHLSNSERSNDRHASEDSSTARPEKSERNRSWGNQILTCFDRNHLSLFQEIFLPSLRAAGNDETVSAITYGLQADEVEELTSLAGVRVFSHPVSEKSPAVLRLDGFRQAMEDIDSDCLVAYWDAGDTVFQRSLGPLWKTARELGDRLGVVAEPNGHNRRAIDNWTSLIDDRRGRALCHRVLSPQPWLNGGFATGKASVLSEYLRTATQMLDSWLLRGTGGYDQTALNMYCHFLQRPHAIIDETWNYCVLGRRKGSLIIDANSQFVREEGDIIPVVHGNAGTLRHFHDLIIGSLQFGETGTKRLSLAQGRANLNAILI